MGRKKIILKPQEQNKYLTIKKLVETNGNKKRAAIKLGVSVRYVRTLISKYNSHGKEAFAHRNRNRLPAHTIPYDIAQNIINLYRNKYKEFNFSHFTEKLNEIENISVSYSAVTSILKEKKIYRPPMNHPWKKASFDAYLSRQKHIQNAKKISA